MFYTNIRSPVKVFPPGAVLCSVAAAGALLVMLVDSMIPEAAGKTGPTAGLLTVLGFSVAAALSALT